MLPQHRGDGETLLLSYSTRNRSRPNPAQALRSMHGQATQPQIYSNLSRHFAPKLLLKKVLSSTPIKIRQNLETNATLEMAYITNLFLIGTINKNT